MIHEAHGCRQRDHLEDQKIDVLGDRVYRAQRRCELTQLRGRGQLSESAPGVSNVIPFLG